MWAILITLVVVFLITTLFGYVVHRSLHQSWTGRLNRAHMTHHLKLYPPSDFYSKEYRDPGKDNTVRIFAAAALPLIALPIVLGVCGILSIGLTILVIIETLFIGWLHDYLHDSFHIINHRLNKYAIFKRWTQLHYLHHVDMKTNYGIFSFHWDRLFRTFWDKK